MKPKINYAVECSAVFSSCCKWRYELRRIWDKTKPLAMFIGLNPSTADALIDDPTVRRCVRYAMDWRLGGLIMTNIFAYRATDPKEMFRQQDPEGPENNLYLLRSAHAVLHSATSAQQGVVVAAWGTHGTHLGRGETVRRLMYSDGVKLLCLSQTKDGHPGHPLYLKKDLKPQLWRP